MFIFQPGLSIGVAPPFGKKFQIQRFKIYISLQSKSTLLKLGNEFRLPPSPPPGTGCQFL